MAFLNQYNHSGSNVYQTVEVDDSIFVLGYDYSYNETPKYRLYISKIDSLGNLVWHKRVVFPDTVIGGSLIHKLHFSDIKKVDANGDLIVLARDLNNVLLIKLSSQGDLIWVKKVYDKSDTALVYSYLSFQVRLHHINQDEIVIVISDIHSYNGGVKKIDYKFIKIGIASGNIILSKILPTQSPYIVIRDQIVYKDTIILVGGSGVVFKIDQNLNIDKSYSIVIDGNPGGYHSFHFYHASEYNPNVGNFALLGAYASSNGFKMLLADLDPDNLNSINTLYACDENFHQSYGNIERKNSGYQFCKKGILHQLDSSRNLEWSKEIRVSSINRQVIPVDYDSDNYIYSQYSKTDPNGYYIIGQTEQDFETCETVGLEESLNFESIRVSVNQLDLQTNDYNISQYADPNISVFALDLIQHIDICKDSSDIKPDLNQSSIHANPTCILPNGQMQSIVSVNLCDTNGNPMTSGGENLAISSSHGQLTSVTDHNNGTYSAVLTGTVNGEVANLNFSIDGTQAPDSVNVTISDSCVNNSPSIRFSLISVRPSCVAPSSSPSSYILIQIYDNAGNPVVTGGHNIQVFTNLGQIVNIQDNSDGTYSAEFFSTVEGIATLSFSINDVMAIQTANITISNSCGKEDPNANLSIISANSMCIVPSKGEEFSVVTVQLFDGNGNPIQSGGQTVVIQTSLGTLSNVNDLGDGTYTANLSSTIGGTAFLTFSVNGVQSQNFVLVTISKKCGISSSVPNVDNSTIHAEANCVRPGNQTLITVSLNDEGGNPILVGGDQVVIESSIGTLTNVVDNNDGTYTAYFSSNQVGLANISFSVNGLYSDNSVNILVSRRCGTTKPDINYSTINASISCLPPDGIAQSTITVQLYDLSGNPILIGGQSVIIHTDFGTLSPTNDNGDGTYTALLSNASEGEATLTFLVDNTLSPNLSTVTFSKDCEGTGTDLDINSSTIIAIPSIILSDGADTSIVSVQLVDTSGNYIITNDYLVEILTDFGSITPTVFDPVNGQYKAELTGSSNGLATLSFTVDSLTAPAQDTVTITSDSGGSEVDLNVSTIIATPNNIEANGTSSSLITVTLLDSDGAPVTTTLPVEVVFANGTTYVATLNQNGGSANIYTANLVSSTTEENVIVSFTVGGQEAIGNTAAVNIHKEGREIPIRENTSIQSPNFYMQAAGSLGLESTMGIHLRWLFRGALGEKHLPKGNHAQTLNNFNRPNDFVKIFRAPYVKEQITLNLFSNPDLVDNDNALWIYRPDGRDFYVYFKNSSKYNTVLATINPMTNPQGFIEAYGSELIEIENKTALFFAVEMAVDNYSGTSSLELECLYVTQNSFIASKIVGARKTYSDSELNNIRLLCENGRSIRYKSYNSTVSTINFELYEDFIGKANDAQSWEFKGEYALTLDNGTAFNGLEPVAGSVHGHWQRYNDDAYVNVLNYQDKWGGTVDSGDRNIKQIVEQFIELSDLDANNPTAIEAVPVDDYESMDISNLTMLNIAAYDYHIARMLGLGVLDMDTQAVSGNQYIYIAEYYTEADLEDGLGAREVQHLSMSLPTGTADERLPLPADLSEFQPGVFLGDDTDSPENLTAEDGYTHDGRYRFVTLFCQDIMEDEIDSDFYNISEQYNRSEFTFPLYAGLEYRKNNESVWQVPELSHDTEYYNTVPSGEVAYFETLPIVFPDPNYPLYVHKQKVSGTHYYNAYGINWFSRAVSGDTILTIETDLRPINPLVPPTNNKAFLIRKENILMLTTAEEQARLMAVAPNEILVRLTWNYHSAHELINYNIEPDINISNSQLINDPNNSQALFPDNEEIFANEIDIFFRNQVPNQITGQAVTIDDHPSNPLLSIITSQDYMLASTGQVLAPEISSGTEDNYIGGVFVINNEQYIIHDIDNSGEWPIFSVYKKEISNSIVYEVSPVVDVDNLQPPQLVGDALFMVIENMQNNASWQQVGVNNPHSFKVKVNELDDIHREVIQFINTDGQIERKVEKTRGIWSEAVIEEVMEPTDIDADGNIIATAHLGQYKFTLDIGLNQHSQYNASGDSVEWYKGIIRVRTVSNNSIIGGVLEKTRKVLQVSKIENIGGQNVIVYAKDPTFSTESSYDAVLTGSEIEVNFYPSYKVYLYENITHGLTEDIILPEEGEGVRNSIFGFRSVSTDQLDVSGDPYRSKISVPALMFAHEIIEPQQPNIELPEGFIYATMPDFFGRSTFSFNASYIHKPHGLLFYRSNDESLLNALYTKSTVLEIKEALKPISGVEHFIVDRWRNFLDFENLDTAGNFETYEGYTFPNPDKKALFDWANEIITQLNNSIEPPSPVLELFNTDPEDPNNDLGDFAAGDSRIFPYVKGAILNAFVSLTEVPIVYEYINELDPLTGEVYQPKAKPQNIRDTNGNILLPTDESFDMAPMMRVTGNDPHATLYTDFNLDGTSDNLYFYAVREMGSTMKLGDFSPFLGPVKLVNTNAPEAPEVKRIMPVLENTVLGIPPSIQLEVNAYPKVQKIKKINIYRAFSRLDAQSIRTMDLVKTIDLEVEEIIDNAIWKVHDTFDDLQEVPYGDALFYRVTVARKVEYTDKDDNIVTEYAPSKASKLVATLMVEVKNPLAPIADYYSEPITLEGVLGEVTLHWNKTCYMGKYHIYKMNIQGNWVKIYEVKTNNEDIYVPLHLTDLNSADLVVLNEDGDPLYHHFKVIAENTSGMFSTEENILTIYTEDEWQDLGGISSDGTDGMIIGGTFIIRENLD
ncbi:Ig-like domain-containing protein [Winogradskyella sp. SYSU M77433]|uniref:Ig-like domain-containing protein n=1 Tax=Winogradskyella sp. SYSU M77433 TaxID=3042722 RepID=UPI002480231E|nr:Ig-like domain-containing protein [Winogradskyella sp. SYSU M77433]MDH7911368.1 Ig-like domain-containing protein [Winogradskyella sp. SYSU M77433]